MNAKIEALTEVRDTLLRIRNEGLVSSLYMKFWREEFSLCGTVCCIAGWRTTFANEDHLDERHFSEDCVEWSDGVAAHLWPEYWSERDDKCLRESGWILLFGDHHGSGLEAWERQMRRVNWLIAREVKREQFESIPTLSRKERRALYEQIREAA